MKVGTIILKVGSFVMITETLILINADPTFPHYMYGVHYFADTWQ